MSVASCQELSGIVGVVVLAARSAGGFVIFFSFSLSLFFYVVDKRVCPYVLLQLQHYVG